MPSRWMKQRYKITKKSIVLGLIIFTVASCIFFILIDKNGTNKELQFPTCVNRNQHWVHYNKTLINQKILTKLKGMILNSSSPIASYQWQEVIPHIFIYSAFNDTCNIPKQKISRPCIKIISIVLRGHSVFENIQPQLVCFMKDRNTIEHTSLVKYTVIKEHHGKCFSAAFIDCLQPIKYHHPLWVSIGESAETTALKWIPTFKYKSQMKEIAVCVRPLYGPFNSSLHLIEFISYYIEAGVEHFYFYDQSIVPEIYRLFELLLRYGKANISLLPWKLPLDNELVHENGQLAHVQDCILRCRNEFKHVILVDIDEYIVPRQQKNLIEMLSYLDKKHSNAGTYVFPMALFCDEYLHQTEQIHSVLPFITHVNIWRQKTLWYYQERSKVIVKPNAIKIGGIHFSWEHVNKYREIWIPADVAIVQHYKSCCGMEQTWILHLLSFNVLADGRIKDKSLLVYKSKMLGNPLIKFLWRLLS